MNASQTNLLLAALDITPRALGRHCWLCDIHQAMLVGCDELSWADFETLALKAQDDKLVELTRADLVIDSRKDELSEIRLQDVETYNYIARA